MSEGVLLDSRVSSEQCRLAVNALHAHQTKKEENSQESELLPGKEQYIWLTVIVKKMAPGHKLKPIKIPIVYPLIDPRTTPVCLITKDPQRQYKDLLETHQIKFISRVVGIEKLKGKFKSFEARRLLLKENGLFLADERIVPLLPKLLGVKWFKAKKQPIPVCILRKDLKGELERAISSTYMNQNRGTCTSIKIGTLSQTPAHILANLKTALPTVAKQVYGGWDNIQAFHIKTNSSASLPIWSCNLDENEGGRWNGLTVVGHEAEGFDTGNDEEKNNEKELDVAEVYSDNTSMKKGKKRIQEDQDAEKPKKKVKGREGKATAELLARVPAGASPPTPSKAASADIEIPRKSESRRSLAAKPLPPPSKSAEPSPQATDKLKPSKKHLKPTSPVVNDSPIRLQDKIKDSKVRSSIVSKIPSKHKISALTVDASHVSLTRDELKKKRSTALGEKKKERVIKLKGRKSAKDGIVGKSVVKA